MIDGKKAVLISLAERRKKQLGYPLRDLLEANDVRGVILSDWPRIGTSWTVEEKVEAYLDVCEAVIVLATSEIGDPSGERFPRLNIADEIARARSREHIAHRICVLKERPVQLPSNVDPAYEDLNSEDPTAAFDAALRQLRAWDFPIPDVPRRPTPAAARPDLRDALQLVDALDRTEPLRTRTRVATLLSERTKPEQRAVVDSLAHLIRTSDEWEIRATASQFLEEVAALDHSIVSSELIDELSRSDNDSVQMSAAVILFLRAVIDPGAVPLDIVERLAVPSPDADPVGSWYVYTPARNTLRQLALTRRETWEVVERMATHADPDAREAAANIAFDVAKHRPAAVPRELVSALTLDPVPVVKRLARQALELVSTVKVRDHQDAYTPFAAF